MGALVWFIAAVVLALAELAAGEFTLLMLAGAAAITGVVSLVGIPLWLEIATFAISAAGLVFFLRPALRKRLNSPKALDTSPRALVGSTAPVLETIDASAGQIRLDGSIWSARSMDPEVSFQEGETVRVMSIDGATAVVWKEV